MALASRTANGRPWRRTSAPQAIPANARASGPSRPDDGGAAVVTSVVTNRTSATAMSAWGRRRTHASALMPRRYAAERRYGVVSRRYGGYRAGGTAKMPRPEDDRRRFTGHGWEP